MYQGAILTAMLFWGVVYSVVLWGTSTLNPHLAVAKMVKSYHYEIVWVEDYRARNNYDPEIDRALVASIRKYNERISLDHLTRTYVAVNRSTGEYAWGGHVKSWNSSVNETYAFMRSLEKPVKVLWGAFCFLCFFISGVAIVRAREKAGMNPFMD